MLIEKEIEFDAAHRVPNHKSKCRSPHGHRYRVVASLEGEVNRTSGHPEEGMLKDFSFVKELLTVRVHDVLDHGSIAYEDDLTYLRALGELNNDGMLVDHEMNETNRFGWKVIVFPYIPTAENIARWVFEQIAVDVEDTGYKLSAVEIYETPTSRACYFRHDWRKDNRAATQ